MKLIWRQGNGTQIKRHYFGAMSQDLFLLTRINFNPGIDK